jgi:hypothetical protein
MALQSPSQSPDYVLFPTGNEVVMDLLDPDVKLAFRQCREKAMTEGDREAIAALGQFIVYQAEVMETPEEQIIAQLDKEYGFDVGRAVQELNMRNEGYLELARRLEGGQSDP